MEIHFTPANGRVIGWQVGYYCKGAAAQARQEAASSAQRAAIAAAEAGQGLGLAAPWTFALYDEPETGSWHV